jgi:membrane protease YdiL (CAAX protease family)
LKVNKTSLFYLSTFTLIGLGGLGLCSVLFIQKISLQQFLHSGSPITEQLFYGFSYGIAVALLAIVLIAFDIFHDTRVFYGEMMKELKPGIHHIIFYSFCAAVGEELLFRAGVQPFIGVWLTSIIFIALHGYISFTDLPMAMYGLFMVVVSAGMGYLLIYRGIYAAISAHFIFDVIMFIHMKKHVDLKPREPEEEQW